MTTLKVVIISGCVSIFVAVLSAVLNHFLAQRRERMKKLWEPDVEKAQKIEELASKITGRLGSHIRLGTQAELAVPLLEQLNQNMGVLLKYKRLNLIMLDFQYAANRVLDTARHNENEDLDKEYLRKTYEKLLTACERLSKGKGK